jgi:hypothetical protein
MGHAAPFLQEAPLGQGVVDRSRGVAPGASLEVLPLSEGLWLYLQGLREQDPFVTKAKHGIS